MTETENLEIEETLSFCDWSELRHIGALAEETKARGLDNFGQDREIAARAAIIFENARLRRSIGRRPCQRAPSELGFRTPRDRHEHAIRAALFVGAHSLRFLPCLEALSDDEAARLFAYVAKVVDVEALTQIELTDADALASQISLGVWPVSWSEVAAIVDANRVHENGGLAPDYNSILKIRHRSRAD